MLIVLKIDIITQIALKYKLNHVCKFCKTPCQVINNLEYTDTNENGHFIILTNCINHNSFIECMSQINILRIIPNDINTILKLSATQKLIKLYFPN
jgi:hypothetical protein